MQSCKYYAKLQIFLSTMNTSVYVFTHSSLRLPSISSFSVLSGEQNIALQKTFTESNLKVSNILLVKLAENLHWEHNECHTALASRQSSLHLKALVHLKIHHSSREVIVSNPGKNAFSFPPKIVNLGPWKNHRITESQNSRGWKGPLWVI